MEVVRINSSKKDAIDLNKIVKKAKVKAKNFKINNFDISSSGVISAEFVTQVRFDIGDKKEEIVKNTISSKRKEVRPVVFRAEGPTCGWNGSIRTSGCGSLVVKVGLEPTPRRSLYPPCLPINII